MDDRKSAKEITVSYSDFTIVYNQIFTTMSCRVSRITITQLIGLDNITSYKYFISNSTDN